MAEVRKTGKARQFIGVRRCAAGYVIFDRASQRTLVQMLVVNQADDLLNTRLRDAVVDAYFEYGKALNIYR